MDEDPTEVVRRVERAIDNLHVAIGDIRNFIFGLRPDLLGGMPLMAGLAALADEFRHNTMIDIELAGGGLDSEPPAEVTAHLLGIVNEALSNVARHAAASRAWVDASSGADGSVVVRVRDNGRGFDASIGAPLGHQGLANMRSRAAGIGASLEVVSDPGSGTTISITLPRADQP